jgi:hypothetical protein
MHRKSLAGGWRPVNRIEKRPRAPVPGIDGERRLERRARLRRPPLLVLRRPETEEPAGVAGRDVEPGALAG